MAQYTFLSEAWKTLKSMTFFPMSKLVASLQNTDYLKETRPECKISDSLASPVSNPHDSGSLEGVWDGEVGTSAVVIDDSIDFRNRYISYKIAAYNTSSTSTYLPGGSSEDDINLIITRQASYNSGLSSDGRYANYLNNRSVRAFFYNLAAGFVPAIGASGFFFSSIGSSDGTSNAYLLIDNPHDCAETGTSSATNELPDIILYADSSNGGALTIKRGADTLTYSNNYALAIIYKAFPKRQ